MQEQKKRLQPNRDLRHKRELRGWSQRVVAEYIGTTEQVVTRWENGAHKPNRHFQTQLCKLFEKSAEELGFMNTQTEKEIQSGTSKEHILQPDNEQQALFSLFSQTVPQSIIGGKQGEIDLNMLRRLLLKDMVGLATGSFFSELSPLVIAQPALITALNQEFVSKANATIAYCWQLYYTGGAFLVEQFMPAFLTQLVPLTQQPSMYQKALANVVSRIYQLIWLLNLQRQNFGQALYATKQSFIYAELAQDPNLLLASLVREAHTFFHLNNPIQQLSLHEKAMKYVSDASPLLQSWLYLVLAESYAHLKRKNEADRFIGLAKDILPEKPEQDPNYSYVPINDCWFTNHKVMAHLHLQQSKDAWDTLQKFDKANTTTPLHVELINRQLMTLYALGDLQATCSLLEIAVRASKGSGSNLRYNEVCNVYVNMVTRWPHEQRVKKLEELLQQ